jgi:uroporphyrinogen-III synthase
MNNDPHSPKNSELPVPQSSNTGKSTKGGRPALSGPGILNTRPREQAAELNQQLREAGFKSYHVPLVELVFLPEGLAELSKLSQEDYDGVLLSSPNLMLLLKKNHSNVLQALTLKPWYLISSRARPQVEALGVKVAFVPRKASLEGFLEELSPLLPPTGLRLLHLCSSATRLDPKPFSERGIVIRNLALYAPRCPKDAGPALEAVWPQILAVLFASGSAVHNLFSAAPKLATTLGTPGGPLPISIGPSASAALKMAGVQNFVQADTADNAGLIAALPAHMQHSKQES